MNFGMIGKIFHMEKDSNSLIKFEQNNKFSYLLHGKLKNKDSSQLLILFCFMSFFIFTSISPDPELRKVTWHDWREFGSKEVAEAAITSPTNIPRN